MIINLTPVRSDAPRPAVSVVGDVLTVGDITFDLSQLAEGGSLPSDAVDSPWIVKADITRVNGEISLTLLLPIGADAPEESRNPQPIHVTTDGAVSLPPFSAETIEQEGEA